MSLAEVEGNGNSANCIFNFEDANLQSGGVDGSGYVQFDATNHTFTVYATNGSHYFEGVLSNKIDEGTLGNSTVPGKTTYAPKDAHGADTAYKTTCNH